MHPRKLQPLMWCLSVVLGATFPILPLLHSRASSSSSSSCGCSAAPPIIIALTSKYPWRWWLRPPGLITSVLASARIVALCAQTCQVPLAPRPCWLPASDPCDRSPSRACGRAGTRQASAAGRTPAGGAGGDMRQHCQMSVAGWRVDSLSWQWVVLRRREGRKSPTALSAENARRAVQGWWTARTGPTLAGLGKAWSM